jgi:hypothetical protein
VTTYLDHLVEIIKSEWLNLFLGPFIRGDKKLKKILSANFFLFDHTFSGRKMTKIGPFLGCFLKCPPGRWYISLFVSLYHFVIALPDVESVKEALEKKSDEI